MENEIFFDAIFVKDKVTGDLIDITNLDINKYSQFLSVMDRVKNRFELAKIVYEGKLLDTIKRLEYEE
jgi:hypothetical protein